MKWAPRAGFVACIALGAVPAITSAQTVSAQTVSDALDPAKTLRAIRLDAPLELDGRLDEPVYASVPPTGDFIQIEPRGGEPATNRTDVWVLFDRANFYVSIRLWETDMERIVQTEMRRDSSVFLNNDSVGFVIDTFNDGQNGYIFWTNLLGVRTDGQSTNERQYTGDWNPVWEVKTARFQGGWSVEAAVPFKSLRYMPGHERVWGLNVQRMNFWKNEISFLSRIPPEKGQGLGMMMVSRAAKVVGLEAPAASKNLDVKPYAISEVTSDATAQPRVSNDVGADFGVDVKYGPTPNTSLDLTYNTDFSQVEADEQQINLTRFNLFFPEKREFFLENAGTFTFGGSNAFGSPAGEIPVMFYSRRIGLNGAREVPLVAGGRLTGRVGRYALGLVNIQSDEDPAPAARKTNFSVVRLKRDILRRSSIGAIYTGRSVSQLGVGRNDLLGADMLLSLFTNLNINAYWAKTQTTGRDGEDVSYRAQLDYAADRYGVQLEHYFVDNNFNPEVGFLRRIDMRREYAQLRFSPRPKTPSRRVRKYWYIGSFAYIENTDGRLETRAYDGEFSIDLQNSDKFTATVNQTYEYLPRPFQIAANVRLPVGAYDYESGKLSFKFGQQRPVAGTVSYEQGTFYNGSKRVFGVSAGRLTVTPQFYLEPSTSINWVDLTEGTFRTTLVGSRVTYTVTPLMFVSALLQYNSAAGSLSTNARLRWEFSAGSELFVVYNEQRDTLAPSFPDLANRAFIVKVNRMFRF